MEAGGGRSMGGFCKRDMQIFVCAADLGFAPGQTARDASPPRDDGS